MFLKYLCEFLGTMMLILLGDGVVANVTLNKSGMKGAGSIQITLAWGLAVMVPAFIFGEASGASFNPALTIALAAGGMFDWALVPGYVIAQILGGIVGGVLVYILFKDHFDATEDPGTKLGVFSTGPSIPKLFGIHGRAMADDKGCWPIQSRMGIDVMSINLLVENEEDPVVWRGPVIAGAVKQFWTDVVWKDVDFLFVDMPPGTGDVPLTVFQSLPVDGIVVVASPQELVSMIVAKAVNMAEMMKVPMLGIVENMSYIVCPDCGKHINVFGNSHVDEVAAKHHLPVLAKCPIDPKLAELSDAGMIETYGGEFLEGAADACEKLLKK